jgi:hypothetical protein
MFLPRLTVFLEHTRDGHRFQVDQRVGSLERISVRAESIELFRVVNFTPESSLCIV